MKTYTYPPRGQGFEDEEEQEGDEQEGDQPFSPALIDPAPCCDDEEDVDPIERPRAAGTNFVNSTRTNNNNKH